MRARGFAVGDQVRLLAYGDEVIVRRVIDITDAGRLVISTDEEIARAKAEHRPPRGPAWPPADVLGLVASEGEAKP